MKRHLMKNMTLAAAILVCLASVGGNAWAADSPAGKRRTISLDGTWQAAEGKGDVMPDVFGHTVPVPGLADMAKPAFKEVGFKSKLREAFWYRRRFSIEGPLPQVAILKIHKAKYGTRVWLNGKLAGDHLPCFTPALLDVRKHLRGGGSQNELVVRVGAFRDSVPKNIPTGWDFEKYRYIPGIYDSVELILTGTPRIVVVQTTPDITAGKVRITGEIAGAPKAAKVAVKYTVREARSGKAVASGQATCGPPKAGEPARMDFRIPIKDCRLWSPEDPFLYELALDTGGDTYRTRFAMRSFRFDNTTGRAVLNGKPYFMRGTNVCVLRFFEDATRGDRPWRREWVRRLHRKFKSMHWNSIRYCIGFPPELWYEIADEEGFLIQDEFPIWTLGDAAQVRSLDADEIAREYTEWMRERWNHACVVIWDAQNESKTSATGKAIRAVRHLDLSDRPWENGWSPPQGKSDFREDHPYPFGRGQWSKGRNPFFLSGLARSRGPRKGSHAIIINEYGWLWLNRDGTPTSLTNHVYRTLLGPKSTTAQRRMLYARYLAALTELYRSERQCAGVLHFCGLGYSRPGIGDRPKIGATSDHFVDMETLKFEPLFEKYVRDAFAPVGLMIDEWAAELTAEKQKDIPVVVINDLYKDLPITVSLSVIRGDKTISTQSQKLTIVSLGKKRLTFKAAIPAESGEYQLIAELTRRGSAPVRSLRDFKVVSLAERQRLMGLAVGKAATASSTQASHGAGGPKDAVDGKANTRWSSAFSDPQWIAIDLGKATKISSVKLLWEAAYAKSYTIEISADGKTWKEVYKTDKGDGGVDEIKFATTTARWIRMTGTKRGTEFGYSLWEFKVFP